MLRPGNVHSAERWREVLEPVVKRYQEKGVRLLFRADAAFAKPEVYEYLESRDTGYAMRLPPSYAASPSPNAPSATRCGRSAEPSSSGHPPSRKHRRVASAGLDAVKVP